MSRVVLRVRPIRTEKQEQALIQQLLRSMGALVYTLGTRRPAGDYQGTRQSAGLPDLIAFLKHVGSETRELVMIEVKRNGARRRMSLDQKAFREACLKANVPHIVGALEDVIAWLIQQNYLGSEQVGHYHQQSRSQWEGQHGE